MKKEFSEHPLCVESRKKRETMTCEQIIRRINAIDMVMESRDLQELICDILNIHCEETLNEEYWLLEAFYNGFEVDDEKPIEETLDELWLRFEPKVERNDTKLEMWMRALNVNLDPQFSADRYKEELRKQYSKREEREGEG